jgi:ligand-binding SRPBCC domain-containing protein
LVCPLASKRERTNPDYTTRPRTGQRPVARKGHLAVTPCTDSTPSRSPSVLSVVADVYELTTSVWLPLPREQIFEFFADARNLERITPRFLRFAVLTPAPIAMRRGALIDYRLRLHGLPLSWKTEITEWNPPHRFVDVQRRGPYAEWVHTHSFDDQDQGTLVRDHVRYRLVGPWPLTRVINAALVGPDTRRIFEFRHDALEAALHVQGRTRRTEVVITRGSC